MSSRYKLLAKNKPVNKYSILKHKKYQKSYDKASHRSIDDNLSTNSIDIGKKSYGNFYWSLNVHLGDKIDMMKTIMLIKYLLDEGLDNRIMNNIRIDFLSKIHS